MIDALTIGIDRRDGFAFLAGRFQAMYETASDPASRPGPDYLVLVGQPTISSVWHFVTVPRRPSRPLAMGNSILSNLGPHPWQHTMDGFSAFALDQYLATRDRHLLTDGTSEAYATRILRRQSGTPRWRALK